MSTKAKSARKTRRQFDDAYKDKIANEAIGGVATRIAEREGIATSVIHRWVRNLREKGMASPRSRAGHKAEQAKPAPQTAASSSRGYKIWPMATKLAAVKERLSGVPAEEVAAKHGVASGLVYGWARNVKRYGSPEAPRGSLAHKRKANNNGKALTPVVVHTDPGARADGRLDLYVKGDRAKLLQVIGLQTVEIIKLKTGL